MVVAASVKLGRDVGQSLPLVGGDAGVPQCLHAQPPGRVDPGSGISVSTSEQDSVLPVVPSHKYSVNYSILHKAKIKHKNISIGMKILNIRLSKLEASYFIIIIIIYLPNPKHNTGLI